MKKTSEKVINKIKKDDIKPKPFWYFIAFKLLLYIISIIAILLGGLALSLVSYLLINQDWSFASPNIFYLIPYAWLLILIIIYFLAYFNFKKFPRTYKFTKTQLLTFIIFASILIAMFLNSANLPEKLHGSFCQKSRAYQQIFDSQTRPWHRPDEGFISGEIIAIYDDKLLLRDLNRNNWEIIVKKPYFYEIGSSWRFIGEKISDNQFEAQQSRPWLRQKRR